jgi:hypothetical protein
MGGGAFTCFQSGAQEWDSAAVDTGPGSMQSIEREHSRRAHSHHCSRMRDLPGGASHAGGGEAGGGTGTVNSRVRWRDG